jgi:monofunctional biosynthetic peptidoglycan transglycosylase
MAKVSSAIVFVFFILFASLAWIWLTTPDANQIKGCVRTKMYQVQLCDERPGYAHLNNIDAKLKNLVLIAEDSAFYGHAGFDWDELENSLKENLTAAKYARGGSTITQQLAKNVFLTFDKSLARKIREALLVTQIEKILTKDKIFEKYLNVIEFGSNIYGVNDASQHYFSKSPSQLNLLEAAYLTYLIPNPKVYSRTFDKGSLTPYSRYRILDLCYKMFRYHKIDESQYDAAKELVDQFPWRSMSGLDLARLNGTAAPTNEIPGEPAREATVDIKDLPIEDESVPVVEPSAEELTVPEAPPAKKSDSPFND